MNPRRLAAVLMLAATAIGQTVRTTPAAIAADLARLQPGGELVLEDGIYGEIRIPRFASGTPARPTVIRADRSWTIDGRAHALVDPGGPNEWGFGVVCDAGHHDLRIEGLVIVGARRDGVYAGQVERIALKDCWIRNADGCGVYLAGADCSIEGCLIEACGRLRIHGSGYQWSHGVYLQGAGHRIARNVIRDCAGYGLHGYPSLSDTTLQANLIYGQGNKSGLLIQSGSGLRLYGNWVVRNGTNLDLRYSLTDAERRVVAMLNVTSTSVDPWSPKAAFWPLTTRPADGE